MSSLDIFIRGDIVRAILTKGELHYTDVIIPHYIVIQRVRYILLWVKYAQSVLTPRECLCCIHTNAGVIHEFLVVYATIINTLYYILFGGGAQSLRVLHLFTHFTNLILFYRQYARKQTAYIGKWILHLCRDGVLHDNTYVST